jgi:hypothetical protein
MDVAEYCLKCVLRGQQIYVYTMAALRMARLRAENSIGYWAGWTPDFAADLDTRRSHTGYVIMMNGGPISWKSVKQKSVSLSTAESEWYAGSEAGKELLSIDRPFIVLTETKYLRIIMREFGFPLLGPMQLPQDPHAVIAMAENPSNRKGARHIDTREHFVDHLVKDRIFKMVQCRTNKMVADALTKNFPAPAFEQCRATILGEDKAPFSAMMCRV